MTRMNVINIRGATMGSIGGYVFTTKDHKMRQIINDLYLLLLKIMNLASFFVRKNILIYFLE